MLLPMAAVGQTAAQDSSPGPWYGADAQDWYKLVQGVLTVPGEMPLFPYYHGDVKLGVSKFGENAWVDVSDSSGNTRVGFQYTGIDDKPYDPIMNSVININSIVTGWKLIVTYKHPVLGWRTIWAYAKFSDLVRAGSPAPGTTGTCDVATDLVGGASAADGWIVCPYSTVLPDSPTLAPHGGRKTNGIVETSALQESYVGPRRVVMVATSKIYDYWLADQVQEDFHEYPVATMTITFDFNKDTKELTMIKDVKINLPPKNALTIKWTDCQTATSNTATETSITGGAAYTPAFSNAKSTEQGLACFELDNNEQIDQGPAVKGYAHFYTEGGTAGDEGQGTVKLLGPSEYHWETNRASTPTTTKYAVAQMIDEGMTHVTKKAFWPHPDYWTVDAFVQGQLFQKLDPIPVASPTVPTRGGLNQDDMATEPETVGTSAQWNFILDCTPGFCDPKGLDGIFGTADDLRAQWRSVETLAVTDLNDADDLGIVGAGLTNTIDRELKYFDNMVFNPWDLQQAVEKHSTRWVEFFTGDATHNVRDFYLTKGTLDLDQNLAGTAGTKGTAEFVTGIDNPTWRSSSKSIKLTIPTAAEGDVASITIPLNMKFDDVTEFMFHYLIPSAIGGVANAPTFPGSGNIIGFQFYLQSALDPTKHADIGVESTTGPLLPALLDKWNEVSTLATPAYKFDFFNAPSDLAPELATALHVQPLSYYQGLCGDCSLFKVDIEFGWYTGTGGSVFVDDITLNGDMVSPSRGTLVNNVWDAYGSSAERVLVDDVLQLPGTLAQGGDYTIVYGSTNYWSGLHEKFPRIVFNIGHLPADGATVKVLYSTEPEGSYEWIIVGRDSNVVDSAGAAHVSHAFDSVKHIWVTQAGLDKRSWDFLTVPYIQQYTQQGDTRYYTECNDHCEEGERAHLRDDFSSIMPVDSSNIILVGGPLASLSMEMANDWGSAIYRNGPQDFYSPGQWDSMIKTFPKNGYAIIGTYMDVDGTVYLYIYGGTGEDTYWATYWFQYYYITYLQGENPGVTSLILKLDYSNAHPPTIEIVKRLNTISEKNPEQDP